MAARALLILALVKREILRLDLATGAVSTAVGDTGPSPDGLVLLDEPVPNTLFWTSMGKPTLLDPQRRAEDTLDYSAGNGGVWTATLDEPVRRALTAPGAVTTGKQLVSDGRGNLYWSDREGARISTCRLDGSGLRPLVVNSPADPYPECVGIAVGDGHLYWTQKGPAKGGRGRIFRAALDLPDDADPAAREDIEVLWSALPEPIDLERTTGDDGRHWLYWTDRGAPPHGNTLNRAPLPAPGEAGDPPEILAGGFDEAIGLAVDDEAGLVYVGDLGGRVRAVPIPGGPAAADGERLVADLGTRLTGMTLLP